MVDLLGATQAPSIESARRDYAWVASRVEELFGAANTGFMIKGQDIAIAVQHDGLQRALVLKEGAVDLNKMPNKAGILEAFLSSVMKELFDGR